MIARRPFVRTAGALTLLGLLPVAIGARTDRVTVYKNPACGCCGSWVKHLQANGLQVDVNELDDVAPARRRLGVPDALASCHTAVVAGYAIEGHVPAQDILLLLKQKPKITGLALPGMVPGSPGMEQGAPQHFATLAFDAGGSRVFATH